MTVLTLIGTSTPTMVLEHAALGDKRKMCGTSPFQIN
jgi:hypothetical protein